MGEIRRPQDSNIDAWGLTHPGKMRTENQDYFFLGALSCGVRLDMTSIHAECV